MTERMAAIIALVAPHGGVGYRQAARSRQSVVSKMKAGTDRRRISRRIEPPPFRVLPFRGAYSVRGGNDQAHVLEQTSLIPSNQTECARGCKKKLVRPTLPTARVSHDVCMDIAAAIILVVLVLVPVVVVIALFVWAARKDGQADRAVQARLGIRRRMRLGR